ncbi:VOC family protein [Qipengyuania sp.]|uniref:VOC family protein n=1 Tax=Qipengyuania sp. TaxID=2004515 RepID=UPI0035C8165C
MSHISTAPARPEQARLEHVNISVSDPHRTADMLERLTGWTRRWEGPAMNGGRTIHLGSADAYIAIYSNPAVSGGFAKGAPMNHIGIAVTDLAAAEAIVRAVGYEPFNLSAYDPGPRSFYFLDSDGIEFEVLSYS